MRLVIRSPSEPLSLASAVRHELLAVDKDQPVMDIKTLEQFISESVFRHRLNLFLLGIFAGLALTLAALGIYSVVSYSVVQRTHEIGIRMALGAARRDVLKLVVGEGFGLTLVGVAIGVAGALATTRFLSSLLYGVRPTDPVTYVAVSVVLTAVALLASCIPARRATKVDPMVALRYE
jgi:putative ABC transport system permease protein